MMDFNRALELLRIGSDNSQAQFREGQLEAISRIIEGHRRQLVVQKQAGGKVLCILLQQKF